MFSLWVDVIYLFCWEIRIALIWRGFTWCRTSQCVQYIDAICYWMMSQIERAGLPKYYLPKNSILLNHTENTLKLNLQNWRHAANYSIYLGIYSLREFPESLYKNNPRVTNDVRNTQIWRASTGSRVEIIICWMTPRKTNKMLSSCEDNNWLKIILITRQSRRYAENPRDTEVFRG